VNQKQIYELENLQRTTKHAATANRALAVLLLVKHADMSLGVYSVDHARRLKYAYLKGGVAALEDKRINSRERILTRVERAAIITTLKTKQPKEVIVGCDASHWTTGLLGLYIVDEFGKYYKSKTSERLLFREAKLSWHSPGKVYEKADPEARAAWVETTKPVLETHWHDGNAVMLCEDEMVLTSRTTIQKIWLPKGEYPPIVETNNTRKRKNFYGFLNLKTGQEHAFITDKQNMGVTAEVLTKVRKLYPNNKLVIIWDNCGWHRGSKVVEWIEADGNTETIHFPPYTPDLNPQEHVWKAGRKAVTHNHFIGEQLDTIAEQFKDCIEGQRFSYELLGLRAEQPTTGGQV
jgi:transposase